MPLKNMSLRGDSAQVSSAQHSSTFVLNFDKLATYAATFYLTYLGGGNVVKYINVRVMTIHINTVYVKFL